MSVLPDHCCRTITMGVMVGILLTSMLHATADPATPVFNTETNDYRPHYNFSYNVFKNLPTFPIDFWMKKSLFENQELVASKLTPEYYLQPEIIPGWNDWHDPIYAWSNRTTVGVYGISIYPSRFDIDGMGVGETVNVSALLHTAFGIEPYQGAQLTAVCDPAVVSVTLTRPSSNIFLLAPTYPTFNATWCYVVNYKITLLQKKNATITIMESKPPQAIDDQYTNEYGSRYISGGSILGLRVPKAQIYIHEISNGSEGKETQTQNTSAITNWLPYVVVAVLAAVGIVAVVVYAKRTRKHP